MEVDISISKERKEMEGSRFNGGKLESIISGYRRKRYERMEANISISKERKEIDESRYNGGKQKFAISSYEK